MVQLEQLSKSFSGALHVNCRHKNRSTLNRMTSLRTFFGCN